MFAAPLKLGSYTLSPVYKCVTEHVAHVRKTFLALNYFIKEAEDDVNIHTRTDTYIYLSVST